MLYCNRCGQCHLISDARFVEWQNVSGTSQRFLDPETEEVVDYGDDDLDSTGDSTTYCPNCDSSDIQYGWEGDLEEAQDQRNAYNDMRVRRAEEEAQRDAMNKIKDSDWDLESNLSQK